MRFRVAAAGCGRVPAAAGAGRALGGRRRRRGAGEGGARGPDDSVLMSHFGKEKNCESVLHGTRAAFFKALQSASILFLWRRICTTCK